MNQSALSHKAEQLLEIKPVCALATCGDKQPLVSLMLFTYLREERVVILTTRKNTFKYKNLVSNPQVSLLLYNDRNIPGEEPFSVTVLGEAIVLDGDDELAYKNRHYLKYPGMGQFITGDDVATIAVAVKQIYLTDNQDQVTVIQKAG